MSERQPTPEELARRAIEQLPDALDLADEDLEWEEVSSIQPIVPFEEPEFDELAEAELIVRLACELQDRRLEALKLYEPLPKVAEFHRSRANERLVRGSNRSGKTLAAALEVCRAITGQDPYGKYPQRDGRVVAVGLDEEHCGSVMWRRLSEPNQFRIVRDPDTGSWRAWRGWTVEPELETKPAPPILPWRFVRTIAWSDKAKNIPRRVILTTGWELNFFSSHSRPPQGWDIDLWWIDEEIDNELWYPELSARIVDRAGCGIWSATPQAGNIVLYDLHQKAEDQAGLPQPDCEEWHILLTENPFIPPREVEKLKKKYTDEEYRVRILGEYAFSSFTIYPEYSAGQHGLDLGAGWQVPATWARFLAVDPGRQVCAVAFLAVPPPQSESDFVLLYDELYIRDCTADKLGRLVSAKTGGHVYEVMLIDSHAGRVKEMGTGHTVEWHYRQAFHKWGITSRHGVTFLPGADDLTAGVERVRTWLQCRTHGRGPYLRTLKGRVPFFEWEIGRYRYAKDAKTKLPIDKPDKRNDHLMDAIRYLAMYDPKWRKPPVPEKRKTGAVRAMEAKKKRRRDKDDNEAIQLGPIRRKKWRRVA